MGLVGPGGTVSRVHPQAGSLEALDVTQTVGELLMRVIRLHAVTSWLSRSVNGDFDSAVVRGDLRRSSEHSDGQSEALSSAAPAHEAQVVEARHLVLHDGRRVSQLRGIILIISRHHSDQSPVRNITKSHHLKRHGKGFVAPPVRRQDRAEKVWAVRAHQLSGVISQHVHHGAALHGPAGAQGARRAHALALGHFSARERGGGRREPSARARVYGNMHHNRFQMSPREKLGQPSWVSRLQKVRCVGEWKKLLGDRLLCVAMQMQKR